MLCLFLPLSFLRIAGYVVDVLFEPNAIGYRCVTFGIFEQGGVLSGIALAPDEE